MNSTIANLAEALAREVEKLDLADRIQALNLIRAALHEVSPFRDEPVDFVRWVKAETVEANGYNPNAVAPPEMRLLELSILEDGYTQPIVANPEAGKNIVVDGFHRNRVGKESAEIRKRIHGYLPVVNIRTGKTEADRMAATIRHNRARGEHGTEKMGKLVKTLAGLGTSDEQIQANLGMEGEEVLRLQHLAKAAKVLSAQKYGKTWELTEDGIKE